MTDINVRSMNKAVPRSQKATGIKAVLEGYNGAMGLPITMPLPVLLAQAEPNGDEGIHVKDKQPVPLVDKFVRPCPQRPRHGFVESRSVKDDEGLCEIFREIEQTDDEAGEAVIMDPIPAVCNAIVNEDGVTVGWGNDGATSGRNAVSLAIPTDRSGLISPLELHGRKLAPDHPYFEIIDPQKGGRPRVVQMRGGPKTSVMTPDYIPEQTHVRYVLEVSGDESLVEFERQVCSMEPGTVVCHPGGSLTSHFGVHCFQNGVPYVTTFPVRVGMTLEPVSNELPDQDAWLTEAWKGVKLGVMADDGFSSVPANCLPILAGFGTAAVHALVYMRNSLVGGRVAGYALARLTKVMGALATGEARHAPQKSRSRPDTPDIPMLNHIQAEVGVDRKRAYNRYVNAGLELAFEACYGSAQAFAYREWPSDYGGSAWLGCANMTLQSYQALARFIREPRQSQWTDLIGKLNNAVHEAHNGGWWLDKVLSPRAFDLISFAPVWGFANQFTLRAVEGKNPPCPSAKVLDRISEAELPSDFDCDEPDEGDMAEVAEGPVTSKMTIEPGA